MAEFSAPDGTQLYYSDDGTGTPVLALAGLTRTGEDFAYLAPHLAHVRLIRMDYRGRGRSARSGVATYTIPVEAGDALALMDHLGLKQAAILGISRGGLIALALGMLARNRLTGVCLVDIGPDIATEGLEVIKGYVGRDPEWKTLAEAAAALPNVLTGFSKVPPERWKNEARIRYRETPQGLTITYDPALRDAVLAAGNQPVPDLWPLFDALAGLPLALIRGANSNLLSAETAAEMRRRRPDMIFAEVPDRGHTPFLDEPESLAAIADWTCRLP